MPLKPLKYPNACLETHCDPIAAGSPVGELLDAMWAVLHEHRAWGLAANQLGFMQAAIVCKVDTWALELINPVIVWEHKSRLVLGSEGCLSFPGVRVNVRRSRWIKVEGFDRDWNPVRVGAKDIRARVLQHEIDHLSGITMVGREFDQQRQ